MKKILLVLTLLSLTISYPLYAENNEIEVTYEGAMTCSGSKDGKVCTFPARLAPEEFMGLLTCGLAKPTPSQIEKIHKSIVDQYIKSSGVTMDPTIQRGVSNTLTDLGFEAVINHCTKYWDTFRAKYNADAPEDQSPDSPVALTLGVCGTDSKLDWFTCTEMTYSQYLVGEKNTPTQLYGHIDGNKPMPEVLSVKSGMGIMLRNYLLFRTYAGIVAKNLQEDELSGAEQEIIAKVMPLINSSPLPLYQASNLVALLPDSSTNVLADIVRTDAILRVQDMLRRLMRRIQVGPDSTSQPGKMVGKSVGPANVLEKLGASIRSVDQYLEGMMPKLNDEMTARAVYHSKMNDIFKQLHATAMDGAFTNNANFSRGLSRGK